MYYVKAKKDKKTKKLMAFISALLLLLFLCVFNITLDKVIKSTLISVSKNTAARALNEAITRTIDGEEIGYDYFVDIVSDESGNVRSVSTKADRVNNFKYKLGDAVMDALDEEGRAEIEIPLGTLTDIGFLYGKGPKIKISVKLYGELETNLQSEFISVGINQTLHRITCSLSVDFAIIASGFTHYTSVTEEYLIAETVIVGEIPDSYTDVNGDDSGIIGQVFDYADIE